jgi:hypothetical protein
MSLILYINGSRADLATGQVIAQTRQVNDLNSLQNRQAGYTNKFSLPKTAHNIKILQFLTLPGSSSNVPYQKNTCSLYSHTGECFVYNGWAQITDGGDSYECVVYDGIIDLYKAIENKSLADLDLTGLSHDKNPETVAATWAESHSGNFRYIIADYNGNLNYHADGTGIYVNMDYLVPSVKVSWLWQKVFDVFNDGLQPTGSIFSMPEFTNLWMTFPKGVMQGEDQETEVFLSEGITLQSTNLGNWTRFLIPLVPVENLNTQYASLTGLYNKHIKVRQSGNYRLEFSGSFNITRDVMVKIGLNTQNTPVLNISNTILLNARQPGEADFTYSHVMQLNANDTICIVLDQFDREFDFRNDGNSMQVRLVHLQDYRVDFAQAFADFSIRDFLNEVVHRFGLTIFKDKYTGNYRFATPEELLETAQTINWSRRFITKESEDYMTGSYAQRNLFTYAYNDKDASYNDGHIEVHNRNLPEVKTLFKSKIYSPEPQPVPFHTRTLNVYKMWERQPSEEQQEGTGDTIIVTKYKPLDKRYYFMYCTRDPQTWHAKSGTTQFYQSSSGAWFESFSGLRFKDAVQNYYAPIANMLNRSLIVKAQLYLSENDIANFDFNKFYYIEQLGGSFLVNKINNYVPGKPTMCELIRIRRGFYSQLPLHITAIQAIQGEEGNQQIQVHFISQLQEGTNITLQYQTEDIWENPLAGTTSPLVFNVPPQLVGQTKRMRLGYQGGISNSITVIWLGTYTIVV